MAFNGHTSSLHYTFCFNTLSGRGIYLHVVSLWLAWIVYPYVFCKWCLECEKFTMSGMLQSNVRHTEVCSAVLGVTEEWPQFQICMELSLEKNLNSNCHAEGFNIKIHMMVFSALYYPKSNCQVQIWPWHYSSPNIRHVPITNKGQVDRTKSLVYRLPEHVLKLHWWYGVYVIVVVVFLLTCGSDSNWFVLYVLCLSTPVCFSLLFIHNTFWEV